jgi:hypothetical protein
MTYLNVAIAMLVHKLWAGVFKSGKHLNGFVPHCKLLAQTDPAHITTCIENIVDVNERDNILSRLYM